MTRCNIAALDRRNVVSFFERQPNAWPKLVVEVLCDRLDRSRCIMTSSQIRLP
jgi:hypothetical protein